MLSNQTRPFQIPANLENYHSPTSETDISRNSTNDQNDDAIEQKLKAEQIVLQKVPKETANRLFVSSQYWRGATRAEQRRRPEVRHPTCMEVFQGGHVARWLHRILAGRRQTWQVLESWEWQT